MTGCTFVSTGTAGATLTVLLLVFFLNSSGTSGTLSSSSINLGHAGSCAAYALSSRGTTTSFGGGFESRSRRSSMGPGGPLNSKSDLRDLRPGPRKARDLRWSALAAGPQRTHFSLWVVGDEWYVMGGVLRMLPVKRFTT